MTCYLCGNCPKIVSTDGNTKDSIKVNKNMVFDYDDDESEIPDLPQFTDDLIEEVLCSALFQHKSEKGSIQNQSLKALTHLSGSFIWDYFPIIKVFLQLNF